MRPKRAAAIPPTGDRTFTAAPVAAAFVGVPVLKVAEPEDVAMVLAASVASVEELVPVMLECWEDCEEYLECLSESIDGCGYGLRDILLCSIAPSRLELPGTNLSWVTRAIVVASTNCQNFNVLKLMIVLNWTHVTSWVWASQRHFQSVDPQAWTWGCSVPKQESTILCRVLKSWKQ